MVARHSIKNMQWLGSGIWLAVWPVRQTLDVRSCEDSVCRVDWQERCFRDTRSCELLFHLLLNAFCSLYVLICALHYSILAQVLHFDCIRYLRSRPSFIRHTQHRAIISIPESFVLLYVDVDTTHPLMSQLMDLLAWWKTSSFPLRRQHNTIRSMFLMCHDSDAMSVANSISLVICTEWKINQTTLFKCKCTQRINNCLLLLYYGAIKTIDTRMLWPTKKKHNRWLIDESNDSQHPFE